LDIYWVARLGALRRGTDLPSPFEQLRRIARIIQHPGYLDTGFINDLALLKLERPVDFSDYVRPVCLPPPAAPTVGSGAAAANTTNSTAPPTKNDENNPIENGHMCTVVGWGQLSIVGRIFRKS
jgi:Trypsin